MRFNEVKNSVVKYSNKNMAFFLPACCFVKMAVKSFFVYMNKQKGIMFQKYCRYIYISNLNARLNAKDRQVYKSIQNGYLQHISTELSTHC